MFVFLKFMLMFVVLALGEAGRPSPFWMFVICFVIFIVWFLFCNFVANFTLLGLFVIMLGGCLF